MRRNPFQEQELYSSKRSHKEENQLVEALKEQNFQKASILIEIGERIPDDEAESLVNTIVDNGMSDVMIFLKKNDLFEGFFADTFVSCLLSMNRETFRKFYKFLENFPYDDAIFYRSSIEQCIVSICLDLLLHGLPGRYPDGRGIIEVLYDEGFRTDNEDVKAKVADFFYDAFEIGGEICYIAMELREIAELGEKLDGFRSIQGVINYNTFDFGSLGVDFVNVLRMTNTEAEKVVLQNIILRNLKILGIDDENKALIGFHMLSHIQGDYDPELDYSPFASVIVQMLSVEEKVELLMRLAQLCIFTGQNFLDYFVLPFFDAIMSSMPFNIEPVLKILKACQDRPSRLFEYLRGLILQSPEYSGNYVALRKEMAFRGIDLTNFP